MGLGPRVGGCSCQDASETSSEGGGLDEIGGSIAGSANYDLTRTSLGPSFSVGGFQSSTYKASTIVGDYLTETGALSENYRTYHPLSKNVLEAPPALRDVGKKQVQPSSSDENAGPP